MMGWIRDRHMRQGGSLNRNPSKQRKGPLRKIVAVRRFSEGLFDAARVELECGHMVSSNAQYRARCDKCAALAAGAQSAETNEDLAQSEGRQGGPKGNAQTPEQSA